jgi:hypothetical protein
MSNAHYLKYKDTIKLNVKEWRSKQDPDSFGRKCRAQASYHYYQNKQNILEKRREKRIFDKERNRLFNIFDVYI